MPSIDNTQQAFAHQCFEHTVTPQSTLARINPGIQWKSIQHIIDQVYPKGLDDMGRMAYNPMILLKMSLPQTWYGLSDAQVEEQTRDRLSFMAFCGINALKPVSDSTLLCRFRKELTQTNTYKRLLNTTKASEHESQHLLSLLEQVDLPTGSAVLGGQGYSNASNESLLRRKRKAKNVWSSIYNCLVKRSLHKVTRVLGGIKSWCKVSGARYVGQAKMHSRHILGGSVTIYVALPV